MFLGDHESYFYNTVNQKHDVLFSNLVNGINAGCSLLYISSGESVDAVQTGLRNLGLKNDNHKKIKVLTSYEWYTPDGDFDSKRVIDQYRILIDEALDTGFAGLYVSADVADTLDYLSKKGMSKEWIDYEQTLGTTFKFPMEAICAYRSEQMNLNSQMLLQLIKGHKHTISHKNGKRIVNDQLIRSTIFQQFKKTLGKTSTSILFDYFDDTDLKQNFNSPTNERFYCLLKSIMKEGGTQTVSPLEHDILEEICAKISQVIYN